MVSTTAGVRGGDVVGHLDILKAALLVESLCAWILLVVVMLGPPRLRVTGKMGCALAFLLTAGVTRLTFTEVETRIQITVFGVVAAILVARQVTGTARGSKLGRWASCVAGAAVGAVVTREIVHHYLENLM